MDLHNNTLPVSVMLLKIGMVEGMLGSFFIVPHLVDGGFELFCYGLAKEYEDHYSLSGKISCLDRLCLPTLCKKAGTCFYYKKGQMQHTHWMECPGNGHSSLSVCVQIDFDIRDLPYHILHNAYLTALMLATILQSFASSKEILLSPGITTLFKRITFSTVA
ncbi:hypothetical protein ACJX0J_040899, partial [Zea mays]